MVRASEAITPEECDVYSANNKKPGAPLGVPCRLWSPVLEFERAGCAVLVLVAQGHRTPKGLPRFCYRHP
jgi:hypothetical protein